jgi:hypothetical protein
MLDTFYPFLLTIYFSIRFFIPKKLGKKEAIIYIILCIFPILIIYAEVFIFSRFNIYYLDKIPFLFGNPYFWLE